MNFVALLLGLAVERLLTHLFHLREFRWLDPTFDALFSRVRAASQAGAVIGVAVFAALATLPVALIAWALMDQPLQIPYFLFAVLVLLFSLGPRDLKEEVNDYCVATEADDSERMRATARELLESEPPEDQVMQADHVTRAIFVQANNRIFGVVLWFVLLGPTGAWAFRVLDLMRHRLAAHGGEVEAEAETNVLAWAVRTVHGVLAWLPARMAAAGYALAGSYEGAVSHWRGYYDHCASTFFDINDDVLACAGGGAMGAVDTGGGQAAIADHVRSAWALVFRTLWLIWCPVFAVLTLYNWMT